MTFKIRPNFIQGLLQSSPQINGVQTMDQQQTGDGRILNDALQKNISGLTVLANDLQKSAQAFAIKSED